MSVPAVPSSDPRAVLHAVAAALAAAPAYRALPPETQDSLQGALRQIGAQVGAGPAGGPVRALADPPSRAGVPSRPGVPAGGTAPAGGAPGGAAPPAGGSGSATGRVGELARATLNAVDFPSFVGGLIKSVFQAIVDATIQQMEAYATLLQEVAKTVENYAQDNVSTESAKDYLADRYPTVFTRTTSGGAPALDVDLSNPTQQLPTFFTELGFDMPAQIDPASLDSVIVPAARMSMAEQRHQTLATMVLLGLNRIVVNEGEINAKLQFHISADETMGLVFDSTQTSMGNMAGTAGKSTFSGNGIMVNTTSLNAQSDLNLRTDLTGEVRVVFSSDVLPLSSFADSAAIQLINAHATVPSSTPLPPPVDAGGTPPAVTTPPAAPPAPPASQASLAPAAPAAPPAAPPPADDPWRPRR